MPAAAIITSYFCSALEAICITFFGFLWALPFWAATVFILQFFRDPARAIPAQAEAVLSIIAAGMHVVGDIDGPGLIKVEGRVDGSITGALVALFLTGYGEAFNPDVVSRMVSASYVFDEEHGGFAIHVAQEVNGVAKKHGAVSQGMFPGYEIHAITNGVHSYTWTCEEFKSLFNSYLPGWANEPATAHDTAMSNTTGQLVQYDNFDLAYESLSGKLVVVWSRQAAVVT